MFSADKRNPDITRVSLVYIIRNRVLHMRGDYVITGGGTSILAAQYRLDQQRVVGAVLYQDQGLGVSELVIVGFGFKPYDDAILVIQFLKQAYLIALRFLLTSVVWSVRPLRLLYCVKIFH